MSCILASPEAAPDTRKLPVADYQAQDVAVKPDVAFAEMSAFNAAVTVTASSGLSRNLMPDLKGPFVHMPHSLASLHMIYPEDAFDGYDVLFACGPHHRTEFAAICGRRGLEGRRIFDIGYGKLDALREARHGRGETPKSDLPDAPAHVLIAPSWGEDNLVKRCGVGVVEELLTAGLRVTLRPHYLIFSENADVLAEVKQRHGSHPHFALESPYDGDGAIYTADIMISDFSGAALEFVALRGAPVLFVDVGKKVVNADWQDYGLEPVELGLRERIGRLVPPEPGTITQAVRDLLDEGEPARHRAAAQIPAFLYGGADNRAASAAAEAIAGLMSERS